MQVQRLRDLVTQPGYGVPKAPKFMQENGHVYSLVVWGLSFMFKTA